MNTSLFIWRVGGLLFWTLLLLSACQSAFDKMERYQANAPTTVAEEMDDVQAPAGFEFETLETAEFEIAATLPDGMLVASNVLLSLWTEDENLDPLQLVSGVTNELGKWYIDVELPIDKDSVDLVVHTPGFPVRHRIVYDQNQRVFYDIGKLDNPTGRIISTPVLDDDDGFNGGDGASTLGSRSGFSYMGTWNNHGRPDYLTTPLDVSQHILEFIELNLPEGTPVPVGNPHYLDTEVASSLMFIEAGELWISFIHEGAGYRNSVGYYTYPLDNPPLSAGDIDPRTIIFPNTSFQGSGGKMHSGDRVYLGMIPANTGVGFFLVPNGWNHQASAVSDKWNTRYTHDHLNTFTAEDFRRHVVLLPDTPEELFMLGFEDLNRPGGDNDFNDAIFVIEASPFSAVSLANLPAVQQPGTDTDGDGVPNNQDLFPDDDQRAFASYTPSAQTFGTLAYEDMWPRTGDYDFNDMVIDFRFTEILNAENQVKEIQVKLKAQAMGASQNHGFAIQLPIDPSLVESVSGQKLFGMQYMPVNQNGTERSLSTAVIPVFTNGFMLFNRNKGMINTEHGKQKYTAGEFELSIVLTTPIDREILGYPPYDPFLIKSQDREQEIHLAGLPPTPKANMNYFNSHDDHSDLSNGFYYVTKNNLPWAIYLPEQFAYPQERVPINDVYPDFPTWATFGGDAAKQWFRPIGGNVDKSKSY